MAGSTLSILDTALALARAGMPALPLYGPTEGSSGEKGKRPRQARWADRANTPDQVSHWFRAHPGSNVGLVTGALSGLVCVDVDPRNGGNQWYEDHRDVLSDAIVERTGSGGLHLWYRHPGGFIASRTGKIGLALGVELKADGGHQCVIAPSVHHTGAAYALEGVTDFVQVRDFAAPLPAWIAKATAAPAVRRGRTETYADAPADVEACRTRLMSIPPAVEGAGGDHATFAACCLGRDHDLSPEAFLPLLEIWNQRNSPPWPDDQLHRKMINAYRYAKAATPGERSPSKDFADTPDAITIALNTVAGGPGGPGAQPKKKSKAEDLIDWKSDLMRAEKTLAIKDCENNIDLILRKESMIGGMLRYNQFLSTVELAENAPWPRKAETNGEWTGHDDVQLLLWFGRNFGVAFTAAKVARVVPGVAKLTPFHPVRSYLDGLVWDGIPRLDSLLPMLFGTPDDAYARAIGACTLIAAVARIRDPGCKVDTMLILEGEQGTRKSTALRILAGEDWFTDAAIDPSSKDAALVMRGRWLVEIGELHGMRRSEADELKAWITRQTDRQRDPYDRTATDKPRQCIFIGTTNQERYLKDETGNRRFWPIRCGTIDVEGLASQRDQLWAEACVRHAKKEPWWLSAELEAVAVGRQGERYQSDPWEAAIVGWLASARDLDGAKFSQVTGLQIAQGALGLSVERLDRAAATRIGAVMRTLKWRQGTIRRGETMSWGYVL